MDYNIIPELKLKFNEDIINLEKNHKHINIQMTDRLGDDMKMVIARKFGHFMEDLNFTVFDFVNNIILSKYQVNK